MLQICVDGWRIASSGDGRNGFYLYSDVRRGDKTHTTNATIILITFLCAIKKILRVYSPPANNNTAKERTTDFSCWVFITSTFYSVCFCCQLLTLLRITQSSSSANNNEMFNIKRRQKRDESLSLAGEGEKKVKQHHNVVDDDEIRAWMEGARGRHIIKVESLSHS